MRELACYSRWVGSLRDPTWGQEHAMELLSRIYSETEAWSRYADLPIQGFTRLPIAEYRQVRQLLRAVAQGEYHVLLPAPPVAYALSSGSTGSPKAIPISDVDIELRTMSAARAMVAYAELREFLEGVCLSNIPPQ